MIELLWPTPLYYNVINNIDEVQNEISSVMDSVNYHDPEPLWGSTHTISNSFGEDFIEKHNLVKTKKMIIDNVKSYCQDIGYNFDEDYQMFSWMTSFKPNEFGKLHSHAGCDISGVYYYKTNGEDGNIIFENYEKPAFFKCYYSKYGQSWIHKPQIGKILLFPPWVLHYVTKNTTNEERNSLAFNIYFNRID